MSTIRITKKFNFETGHALYGYDGKCKNVHGHSYKLYVTVSGKPITDNSPDVSWEQMGSEACNNNSDMAAHWVRQYNSRFVPAAPSPCVPIFTVRVHTVQAGSHETKET